MKVWTATASRRISNLGRNAQRQAKILRLPDTDVVPTRWLMGEVENSRDDQLQKQLRALVTAVRPSILWRIDGVTQPLDLLDDDGVTGWQVGLAAMAARLPSASTGDSRDLREWIVQDQDLERSRWCTPRIVLAHARVVLTSNYWQLSRDQIVLQRWLDNIEAALQRSPSTHLEPERSTQRHAAHLVRILRGETSAAETLDALRFVANLTPRAGHLEGPYRGLVTKHGIKVLKRWLDLDPAVGKPMAHARTRRSHPSRTVARSRGAGPGHYALLGGNSIHPGYRREA